MDVLSKKVYDMYFSTHYSKVNTFSDDLYHGDYKYASKFVDFIGDNDSKKIVDLGCGIGMLVSGLIKHGYQNVSGADASHENIDIAKSAGLNVCYSTIHEHMVDCIAKGKKYDVVFLLDVIEHFDRKELADFFRLATEYISDDGILIIKTINAESLISPYARYMDITHLTSFTSRSLDELFVTFGFVPGRILNGKINKPGRFIGWFRYVVKYLYYYFIYRILEGRDFPDCIDLDLVVSTRKAK